MIPIAILLPKVKKKYVWTRQIVDTQQHAMGVKQDALHKHIKKTHLHVKEGVRCVHNLHNLRLMCGYVKNVLYGY